MLNTFSMQLYGKMDSTECYKRLLLYLLTRLASHNSAYFYWYTFVRGAYCNKLYPHMVASAVTLSTA